ncbi:MAG: M20/M25/M40 family metallo-hydrolase [Fidelibacterota bacterium]|nr:MAG: M20/M25/M40 family metallo-hydrolase [Candidatus Neomarinimicrobiota bacterium]
MRRTPSYVLSLLLLAAPTFSQQADAVQDTTAGLVETGLPDSTISPPDSAAPVISTSLAERYRANANRLIQSALADSFAYRRLAVLVDTFGPRFAGTQSLEDAIDWILAQMRSDNLENVHGETVMVPRWVRGEESAELLVPRKQMLDFIGLGGSVGTPRKGITERALVVNSFSDLQAKADQARSRIVVYNVPFTNYGETVNYRWAGASEAAKVGAVASLVRSVTPLAMAEPHTGSMGYEEGVRRIPHGAITVEDALLLQRMQDQGEDIVIRLKMGAHFRTDTPSRNVVAEIVGRELPEEVVVIGGHIDSWDVGQGAMDDGGGCVATWEVVRLLHQLNLRPRRTIRVVLWTNEEIGLSGGRTYKTEHEAELENHILAIESDYGVFKPEAFTFTGSPEALGILREIASLLESIGPISVVEGGGGADISPMTKVGVPGMGLNASGDKYFWYHHTNADTFDKLDPHELNLCVAALAVMAYVVADMPDRLPR